MTTEPKWKSYIVETTQPIFTPEQCQMIIEAGRAEPKQDASVGILKLEHHILVGYHLIK